jgi:diacylglycerol kinase family enzyme
MIVSSNISTMTAVTAASAVLLMVAWVTYAKYRWKRSLQVFLKEHGNDDERIHKEEERGILLIVNPASGGGKSIRMYETVLCELHATGRAVHVIVTKGSEHLLNLTQHIDVSSYKVIAIMGGDSTITEFVQHDLVENKGRWPYSPILHLPAGTGNAIAREMFGSPLPSMQDIIRHGMTKSKRASVLQITSTNMMERYALHNCFDGAQRHMLQDLDQSRAHLYPAFGPAIVLPILMASLFWRVPKDMQIPYFLAIISDTEGMDTDLDFGISRFDDQMIVMNVEQWPGSFQFLRLFLHFMSGRLAKDWRNDKLHEWVRIKKTNQFTLEGDASFHMYLDGGGSIPCQGKLPIAFQVIPDAIPYFVHDGGVVEEDAKKKD